MTAAREALERLTRWRKGPVMPGYQRSLRFLQDVSALLSLIEWRPISEAPKDGTAVLTYPHYVVTQWEGGGWVDEWDDGEECWKHIRHKVTHFLPLPPAPTEDINDR